MSKKSIYQEPEVSVIALCLDSSVMAGSVAYSTDAISGEEVIWGTEFNPW